MTCHNQSRIQDKFVQTMRPDGGGGSGFGGGECTHSFTPADRSRFCLLVVTTYISGASQHRRWPRIRPAVCSSICFGSIISTAEA